MEAHFWQVVLKLDCSSLTFEPKIIVPCKLTYYVQLYLIKAIIAAFKFYEIRVVI